MKELKRNRKKRKIIDWQCQKNDKNTFSQEHNILQAVWDLYPINLVELARS